MDRLPARTESACKQNTLCNSCTSIFGLLAAGYYYAECRQVRLSLLSTRAFDDSCLIRLQHKAIPTLEQATSTILELHGSLKHVHCLQCHNVLDRDDVQVQLDRLNPSWYEYLHDNIKNGTEPKTNPDGRPKVAQSVCTDKVLTVFWI